MTRIGVFGLAAFAAVLAGCTSEVGNVPEVGEVEALQASGMALTNATAGNQTGLVGRWRTSGSSTCSAVFLPDDATGTTSTWVLTAQHCANAADPTVYSVVTVGNVVANVDKVYFHPLAEWNLGEVGNHGKVDMVLAHLTSTVNLSGDTVSIASVNASRDLLQESARMNGTWTFSYDDSGSGSPDATWATRMATNIGNEPGDSGSPVWRRAQVSGAWMLEGLLSSEGSVSTAFGFHDWLMDARTCGPYDTSDPDPNFCSTTCKCGVGEGDCDSDSECETGLICGNNNGNKVGLPDDYDVCVEPVRESSSTSGYCASIGGCQIFEGDCNTHEDCKGDLICRPNVGYAIGETDATDVCDLPRMPGVKVFNNEKVTDSGRCTVDEPCSLGDGDCDPTNHATCRGYLKCKANVGSHFGYATNSVDVCVHPDFY